MQHKVSKLNCFIDSYTLILKRLNQLMLIMKKINSQIRRIFLSFLLFSVQAVYGAKYDEIKAHGKWPWNENP